MDLCETLKEQQNYLITADGALDFIIEVMTVTYTHLTLPTITAV